MPVSTPSSTSGSRPRGNGVPPEAEAAPARAHSRSQFSGSQPAVWGRLARAILIGLALILPLPVLSIPVLRRTGIHSRLGRAIVGHPLVGVVSSENFPHLSWNEWSSGAYQEKFGRWFTQNIGFRAYLVRSFGQFAYSGFQRSYMYNGNLVIGREGELYELAYVRDYCGAAPTVPPAQLRTLGKDLKRLQAALARGGTAFTVLITPSKAAVYPGDIPAAYRAQRKDGPRNYDGLVQALRDAGVPFVDGHQIMRRAQTSAPVPLFCRGGTHWNRLGAALTLRSMLDAIRATAKNPPAPLVLNQIRVDDRPEPEDKDLAELLNVLHSDWRYPTPHVNVRATPDSHDSRKPSALFVGGSFNWSLLSLLDEARCFRQIDFYYYYRVSHVSYPKGRSAPADPSQLDWQHDVVGRDLVVLEINEAAIVPGDSHYAAFVRDALTHLSRPHAADSQPSSRPTPSPIPIRDPSNEHQGSGTYCSLF